MDRRVLQNAVRNVLDGELLNRYLYLSTMERGELAKKIGTTPDIVSACPPPPAPHRPVCARCPLTTPSPRRSWMTCWRRTESLPTSRALDAATSLPLLYKTRARTRVCFEKSVWSLWGPEHPQVLGIRAAGPASCGLLPGVA